MTKRLEGPLRLNTRRRGGATKSNAMVVDPAFLSLYLGVIIMMNAFSFLQVFGVCLQTPECELCVS